MPYLVHMVYTSMTVSVLKLFNLIHEGLKAAQYIGRPLPLKDEI